MLLCDKKVELVLTQKSEVSLFAQDYQESNLKHMYTTCIKVYLIVNASSVVYKRKEKEHSYNFAIK